MLRKTIFWIHLITGVTVGAVIFVMAVTGSIMAFEPQIVDFAERKIRHVEIPSPAERMSLNPIAVKAQMAMPGSKLSGILLESAPDTAVIAQFGKDGGMVYIHPYTGEILGRGSKVRDFMHWVEDLHRKLLNGETGGAVTHFCNAAFFFLILGGFYLWWPRKTMKFKPGLSGKARDWNWHNTIGFWCLPMLLMTTLTGLIMSYAWANHLLYRVTGSEPPAAEMMQKRYQGPPDKSAVNFDLLKSGIDRQAPGWQSASIRLKRPGDPAVIYLREAGTARNFMKSKLVLDPQTGETLTWEPYANYNAGRKARTWTKFLHTGESFGWVTQVIAFLSACGIVMLVWTGFSMALFRFKKSKIFNGGKNVRNV